LLFDTTVIGVVLTLFVVVLDVMTGAFRSLDAWFYDQRAGICQHWSPAATDKLVFVDLDDASLAATGRWPWPRSTLAAILDEINTAGAKAVALDIVFPEPTDVRTVRRGSEVVDIDDDAIFAAAIARAKNVLIPVSLTTGIANSTLFEKIREFLRADLEIGEAELYQRLLNDPSKALPPGSKFPTETYIQARRAAMNDRLTELVGEADLPIAELRKKLVPRTDPEFAGSPMFRLLDDELRKVQAIRPLTRFSLPIPPGLGSLVALNADSPPVAAFSNAAALGGYVNYFPGEGGKVRQIPLFVNQRGRLFPQIALALACASLDVDVRTVKIEADAITIPRPAGKGPDIRIPVRSIHAPQFGQSVGLFMDVPVRGTRTWEYIFDDNGHQKPELHISMAAVWDVQLIRQRIAKNNENLDRALRTLLDDDPSITSSETPRLGLDAARYKQFIDSMPAAEDIKARVALVEYARQQLKETGNDQLPLMKDSELPDARERVKRDEVGAAIKGIERAMQQNARFQAQLADRRAFLRDKISDRAVLVGWAATGTTDKVPTAIQPDCPGVVVHGMVYNGIMTGELWRHAPKWVTVLLTLLIGLAVTASNGFLGPTRSLLVTIVLGLVFLLVNGFLLFDYANTCVELAAPITTLAGVWSAGALAGFIIEARERAAIRKRFSSYVDPKLVDYVDEHPNVTFDGQVREMSVIFTDLAGFTTLSEKLREETVAILSDYLSLMVPIIRRHDGFVNKFLGDGIMCFYNAPRDDVDHAAHAVQTCLEMQEAMKTFADRLDARGLPRVAMRCGVSTGTMVVGDSGPADASDYTVLGDAVNFASRLEGANKVTGTLVLISQRTVELIEDKFLVRPVGRLQVVGKTQGVMTYEPLAKIDDATAEHRLIVSLSAELVAAYVSGDFGKCIEVANRMDAELGQSKLAALYRRTCEKCIETPPGEDFAGNITLTEK